MIKIIIKKIIVSIASHLSHNSILFESLPDFTDSSSFVFNEMIKRGLNKKYKMIWICHKEIKNSKHIKNVKFVTFDSFGGLAAFWQLAKAKCMISCNTFLVNQGNYQKAIFLTHGMCIKKTKGYKAPDGIDYVISTSEQLKKIVSSEINICSDKFITTGLPRNDSLFSNKKSKIHSIFEESFTKIIVWYPTFRQHNTSFAVKDSNNTLPIIHNIESAKIINDFAKELNVLIVLKPHYSQNISYLSSLSMSNVVMINDDFFRKNNITSYEFVGACDALITDYSGIYFDYLLCDKPIGAVWEDIEEYRSNRGFALDIDYYMKGAVKIYNVGDFVNFIRDVKEGNDTLSNQRDEIKRISHFYYDNKSTDRVVTFIENNILGC